MYTDAGAGLGIERRPVRFVGPLWRLCSVPPEGETGPRWTTLHTEPPCQSKPGPSQSSCSLAHRNHLQVHQEAGSGTGTTQSPKPKHPVQKPVETGTKTQHKNQRTTTQPGRVPSSASRPIPFKPVHTASYMRQLETHRSNVTEGAGAGLGEEQHHVHNRPKVIHDPKHKKAIKSHPDEKGIASQLILTSTI